MKKTIEEEINEAINVWNIQNLTSLLKDCIPLFELYDVTDEHDWVKEEVGEDNEMNVRLIRTIYLVSKLAENQAGKLAAFKMKFPNLYLKMEKHTHQI